MASTSEELSSQAEQLQQTMGFFKIGDGSRSLSARRTKRVTGAKAVNKPAKALPGEHKNVKKEQADTGEGMALNLEDDGSKDEEFERF
jgi:methyl-accepting chemotaxis protein